jgi:hypothetical protein
MEDRWAHGWLGGLVSPYAVQTQQKCPRGVAKVTTQLSFGNMVASIITGGIYTPMDITVVCAE